MAFQPTLSQLERWVSVDRLTKYAAAPEDTVALYKWNADLSGALFELIGHTEVMLRNVVHAQLAPHSMNGAWYDDPYYRFNANTQADIAKAKRRAGRGGGRGGGQIRPGKVVAELTFGFWRYLFANTYSTTVWPRVSRGLVGVPRHERDRGKFETSIARVHDVRNRVAHHEPIFHTNIAQHFADLSDVVRHIDAAGPQWFWEVSRVNTIMINRPR